MSRSEFRHRTHGKSWFPLVLVTAVWGWTLGLVGAQASLIDVNPGAPNSSPSNFVAMGGTMFFSATDAAGTELWKSDGTLLGTVRVKDINPGGGSSNPQWLTVVGSLVFFQATDGVTGQELWRSDGTDGGTFLVEDIRPGALGSVPQHLAELNGVLFFAAADDVNGNELWSSDGTPTGTNMLVDLFPGGVLFFPPNSSNPQFLTNVNGTLFFQATNGTDGAELFSSDGTAGATGIVKDIFPGVGPPFNNPNNSFPTNLRNVGGLLYFTANDGSSGTELWSSDGTLGGTNLVSDINPGAASASPANLTAVGSTLFFQANDGTNGVELWSSTGPGVAGLVRNINTAAGAGSNPSQMADLGGVLVFQANDGASGAELWRSDGTTLGTTLIQDIRTGGASSSPSGLLAVTGGCASGGVFAADNGVLGFELWKTDGTSAGTQLVQDIRTGASGSGPNLFAIAGSNVFFRANDGVNGNELWVAPAASLGDTMPPVFAGCPSDIAVNAGLGSCDATVSWTPPTATDNCGAVTVTSTHSPGATFTVGTYVVVYTATDGAGLTATCSFNVTVADVEPPTVVCPGDITVNNDFGVCGAVVVFATPAGSDNCPGVSVAQTGGPASGTQFPVGTTSVTFTATDAVGLMGNCSFNVTVVDAQAPSVTCPADITVNNDPAACGAVVTFATPAGSDNCPGVSVSQTGGPASGTQFPVGTTSVTFTATDGVGLTSACSFNVTVVDAQAPSVTCPADITMNNDPGACGAVVTFATPAGSDNCPGVSVAQTAGPASGTQFPVGTTSVTFTATDGAGLTSVCSFNVTVVDAEAPSVACPADITMNNDPSACGAVVTFATPAGSDNCPGVSVSQTGGPASGTQFPVGTTAVTFTATDGAGLTSACSFNVTVVDAESPSVACPADITMNNDPGACGAVVTFATPGGSDNCPGVSVAQTAGPASGTQFPVGTTAVTFTATDGAGLITSCSFNVTVVDAEAPSVACPADITMNNDPGACGAVVTFATPAGSDNCPGVSVAQTGGPASGTQFPVGTTSVTFMATDGAGLTSACSFNVTVVDAEAPSVACPADITMNNDLGACGAVVTFATPAGSDNCPGVSVAQTGGPASGAQFPVGTTAVTFTATDGAGLTSACSFNVTVVDAESPSVACPGDITMNNDPGACGAVVTFATPAGSDNCPGVSVAQTGGPASGTQFPLGTTSVTFTATDGAGLTTSCSFNVTVVDAESPSVSCPADITMNNDPSACGAVVTFATPAGSDNCPGVSVAQTGGPASGTQFPVGTTSVTFTATDGVGLTTSCSFNVTVVDAEAPSVACPADITMNNDPGACGAVVTFATPAGSDNCPGVSVAQTAGPASGTQFPVGTTAVTFTATDGAGLITSCSFNVTVVDAEGPSMACPADITMNNDLGACGAVVTFATPAGSDNCPGVSVAQTAGPASGTQFPVGTTSVTFTATDGAGLTTSCSFNVTVVDAEAPSVACPTDITMNNDPSACGAVVTFGTPAGSDNCPGVSVAQTGGPASGTQFSVGTTSVTFTATDGVGLTTSCSFNVTIVDAEPPGIACPPDVNVNADPGACTAVVTFPDATATDNCPGVTVLQSGGPLSGSAFAAGSTTVSFTATDAAGLSTSCSFTVTVVGDPPVISQRPASQTVCEGTSVTFSIMATGTGTLTYQWRKDLVPVPGATSSSLTINPVQTSSGGTYDCVVTNACGSATSAAATLTVETVPVITQAPASQNVCEGSNVTFSVSATGGSLTYQWRKNGSNILGEVASLLMLSGVLPPDAGSFDVVVTNACGMTTSSAAILVVTTPVGEDPCSALIIPGTGPSSGNTTCLQPQNVLLPQGGCGVTNHASNDQWWVFTPTCDGTVAASTCPLSGLGLASFDTHLSAFEGPAQAMLVCPFGPGSGIFTELACNDDAPGCAGFSSLAFPVIEGRTYYLRVAGADASQAGSYVMDFTFTSFLTLALTQPFGPGTVQLTNTLGRPGDIYFSALTFNPANASGGLGSGWWYGVHIDLAELTAEVTFPGGIPFLGILDPAGGSSYLVGGLPPIPMSLYGVTTTYDPATGFLTCISNLLDTGPIL